MRRAAIAAVERAGRLKQRARARSASGRPRSRAPSLRPPATGSSGASAFIERSTAPARRSTASPAARAIARKPRRVGEKRDQRIAERLGSRDFERAAGLRRAPHRPRKNCRPCGPCRIARGEPAPARSGSARPRSRQRTCRRTRRPRAGRRGRARRSCRRYRRRCRGPAARRASAGRKQARGLELRAGSLRPARDGAARSASARPGNTSASRLCASAAIRSSPSWVEAAIQICRPEVRPESSASSRRSAGKAGASNLMSPAIRTRGAPSAGSRSPSASLRARHRSNCDEQRADEARRPPPAVERALADPAVDHRERQAGALQSRRSCSATAPIRRPAPRPGASG